MRKDDTIRLRHMADAASEALGFAKTAHRRDLDSDRKLVLALVKDVEILGEAACRISPETRDTFPDLPWEDMVGMRHRLVHAYFDINLDILWRTVEADLPPLLARLQGILEKA